jgi:hypothetical protein
VMSTLTIMSKMRQTRNGRDGMDDERIEGRWLITSKGFHLEAAIAKGDRR